jgi:hypothetical protein
MATNVVSRGWIELPTSLLAAMVADLPAPTSGSPLELLRDSAPGSEAHWERALAERDLVEDGELVPWLVRSLSVLQWPESIVRTRDTVTSAPAIRCVAADTLVLYEQARGVCRIGHPLAHDAFVDELVALCTSTADRVGEPSVLDLTRWTLQAVDIVLGNDRTGAAARAALAALTSSPDGRDAIIDAMVADKLLVAVGDTFVRGPALAGWDGAIDSRSRLELQRLDVADGPESGQVSTMVFIGPPGDRCLIVPQGGDDILLVQPTTDEASILIDAFLTPAPTAPRPDEFAAIDEAWRASADALIAARPR